MKISALASLLGVAATTFLPGVAASEASSLRGQVTIPDEVDFLGLGIQCDNWYPEKCAGTGGNTCYRVMTQCKNICQCTRSGNSCTDNSCREGSGSGSSRNCNNIGNRNTCQSTNGCIWEGNSNNGFCRFANCNNIGNPNTCRNTNGCIWTGSNSNGQCRFDNSDDDDYDDDDDDSISNNRSCRNRNRNNCDKNAPDCAWMGSNSNGQCINNNFCGEKSWQSCQLSGNGCERATLSNGVDFCRPDSSLLLKLFGFDPLASNDHDYKDGEVEVEE